MVVMNFPPLNYYQQKRGAVLYKFLVLFNCEVPVGGQRYVICDVYRAPQCPYIFLVSFYGCVAGAKITVPEPMGPVSVSLLSAFSTSAVGTGKTRV